MLLSRTKNCAERVDISLYLGDGTAQTRRLSETLRSTLLAVEPGVYWDIALSTSPPRAPQLLDSFAAACVAVLGVAPARAAHLVAVLDGVPWRVRAHYVGVDEPETVIELAFGGASHRDAGEPPPATLDGAAYRQSLEALDSVDDVLAVVFQPAEGVSTSVTRTAAFLQLGRLGESFDAEAVVAAIRAAPDSETRTELTRGLLRRAPESWQLLRPLLFKSFGQTAMDFVDALCAEADPRCLSALVHVLSRRHEYVDIAPEFVLEWGLVRLRYESGMDLAALLERAAVDPSDDLHQRRLDELRRWLSWWDRMRGASEPF